MKGVLIPTFLFILLTFILIFVAFELIAPVVTNFFTLHYNIQSQIETSMYGNVTNATQEMKESYDKITSIIPWLLVFGFILAVFVYLALTEIRKGE